MARKGALVVLEALGEPGLRRVSSQLLTAMSCPTGLLSVPPLAKPRSSELCKEEKLASSNTTCKQGGCDPGASLVYLRHLLHSASEHAIGKARLQWSFQMNLAGHLCTEGIFPCLP